MLQQSCPRTLALYHPGEPMPGVNHHFAYHGEIPCTGPLVCTLCGQRADSLREVRQLHDAAESTDVH